VLASVIYSISLSAQTILRGSTKLQPLWKLPSTPQCHSHHCCSKSSRLSFHWSLVKDGIGRMRQTV